MASNAVFRPFLDSGISGSPKGVWNQKERIGVRVVLLAELQWLAVVVSHEFARSEALAVRQGAKLGIFLPA
jgi:hypothetical protein